MFNSDQYFRDGLKRSLKHLVELIELDAPKTLLAGAFHCILHYANGAFGKELWAKFAENQVDTARRHSGFCKDCDSQIPAKQTFDEKLCEQCEARLDDEVTRLTKEAGL